MTGDSSSILGNERSAQLSVIALDQQIADHKKADGDRSVLGWAVSQIWRSDEGSLTRLEKLSKDVHEAEQKGDKARVQDLQTQITSAIQSDKDAVGLQGEISHYGGGALKTAALFFGGGKSFMANRGAVGLAATVGLYGLDQAKMSDDAGTMATNLAFGGAKGALTKGLFHSLGNVGFIQGPAAKGIVLGMGSRIIDTTLTPANYKDADGNVNLAQGLSRTLSTAADPKAMLIDAAMFSAAHGLTRGANWLTAGAVDARPMYQTVLTSASFGLSGGAYHEMDRQVKAGEDINLAKILGRGLLQGGVDMIAGVPGGLNADANFRSRPWESLKEDAGAIASRFGFLNEKGIRSAEASMFGDKETGVRRATDGAEPTDGGAKKTVAPETEMIAETTGDGKGTSTGIPEVVKGLKAEKAVAEPAKPIEYPADQVAAAKVELDSQIGKINGREPSPQQITDLVTYLKAHPEGDSYAATLYVRNFSNPAIRRVLESFYKPAFAMQNEVALASPNVRHAYEQFDAAIRLEQNRSILPHIWGERIRNLIRRAGPDGPALRELIDHHGRTTYDEIAAKAIDAAFGTKYESTVDGKRFERTLPLTEKDLEYVRAIALGKPLPGGPTRIAGEVEVSSLMSGVHHEFTAADLARAREVAFLPSELVREAQRGLTDSITKEADVMRNGNEVDKIDAANRLADHLAHESAKDWFMDWIKMAPSTHISAAGELAKPAVQALVEKAPDAVREFLAAENTGLPLSYRFRSLSEIATAFEAKPTVAERVLRVAGSDPTAMRQIGYELTRGYARGAYAKWLEAKLTPAEGIAEAVKPEVTLADITGDGAMRAARIFAAFGDGPVARYMERMAEVDPESVQTLLQKFPRADDAGKDGKAPRGADLQNLVKEIIERRIAEGIEPNVMTQQLNPNLLQMEIRLNNSFRRNPKALETLLTFARQNLDDVSSLINMPMTPEGQAAAGRQAPRGKTFDRNDPAVKAQMDMKKLSMAYMDMIGMMVPKAAEMGPQAALAEMKRVQALFADAIIKNYAANLHSDNVTMRQNAELAERELNKATDALLPENEAVRRDMQLRREAIAKQDANLLPGGPPPDINGEKPQREQRGGGSGNRGFGAGWTTRPEAKGTQQPPLQPEVVAEPPAVTEPKVVTEPRLDAGKGDGTGGKVIVETETTTSPPPELVVEPPKEIDLGIGVSETRDLLRDVLPKDRRPPTKITPLDPATFTDPAIEAKRQEYERKKGRKNQYDDEGDGSGGGKRRKAGGYRSAREWREAQRDDDY